MNMTKGNKTIDIPCWVIVLGLLVVDNAICNICKTKILKKD